MVLNSLLRKSLLLLLFHSCTFRAYAQERLPLSNDNLDIHWAQTDQGFVTSTEIDDRLKLKQRLGEYVIYYSDAKPESEPMLSEVDDRSRIFPIRPK